MSRLHKKCLLASSGLHGFLLLLLVFGSAFFVAKEKPLNYPKLQFVPSKFVEGALAGGGGNPNIARTDDVQKGDPTAPPPAPKPPAEKVQPPPPQPKQEPPKAEVKPEPPKPETPAKKPPPKPAEVVKPKSDEPAPQAKPRIDLSELKPVTRTQNEKASDKAKAEAEAKAKAAKEAARQENAARQRLAQQLGKAAETMQRGFASGTKVDVGGPGGEAYANYGAFVQQAYDDAWKTLPDLNDDDAVVIVRVTIARDGHVVSARIITRSGSAIMNKSVQRALDDVKKLPPFPEFIRDSERSFTIEFNLKAKRLG